jgi:hypothetical protein
MLETMMSDEGPVPGNARATLAALLASRGATAEARVLAERVTSERDLIHHGAYGLGTAYAQLRDPATALIRGTNAIRCSTLSGLTRALLRSWVSYAGRVSR